MHIQDQIINYLNVVGPTFPSRVAKNINTEILLASAQLSFLASQGKVKISQLKVGGSPLYYLPGQEDQLYNFAKDSLNQKDFEVLQQLKEQKVLRENELSLLAKVSLRSLNDFAIPLHVTIAGNTELFWKWFLLSSEETSVVIGEMLSSKTESLRKSAEQDALTAQKKSLQSEQLLKHSFSKSQSEGFIQEQQDLKNSPLKDNSENEKSSLISKIEDSSLPLRSSKEKMIKEPVLEKNVQKKLFSEDNKKIKKEKISSLKKEKKDQEPPEGNSVEIIKGKEEQKGEKIEEKSSSRRMLAGDGFLVQVKNYLKTVNITVEQKETIRKNSEINLLINVSSNIGATTYFCKAKNKKKCDEKDLSLAYMEAQIKKLPLLFLYPEEMSKKTQEMLDSGAFNNVIIKKMKLPQK